MALQRAAVVVGVNRTGGLPVLRSAASGARKVAQWLIEEGFQVECLTDQDGPVTSLAVCEALEKYVKKPPRYHQLLVYFSGHGYWVARADLWLLSGAPRRSNEAINLDGAMDLAKYCGIPSVVFFSDACRTVPDSRQGNELKGINAIPNLNDIVDISKVDYFKATSEVQQAYEANIDGKPASLLTYALQRAFEEATDDMVLEIEEDGTIIKVVPNRRLESFLQDKVNATLASINPALSQRIDANVPSSDDVYIATVKKTRQATRGTDLLRSTGESLGPELMVARDAANTIGRALSTRGLAGFAEELALEVEYPKTDDRVTDLLPYDKVEHFETGCGFTVLGAVIEKAVCTSGPNDARVESLDKGNGLDVRGVLRVWHTVQPGVTVVVGFADGRAVILPALPDYIGHAVVADSGLVNVSYVPSMYSPLFPSYARRRDKIDRLRALVSLSVEQNTLRLRSGREATKLADTIRGEKVLDPTLGLYAAHAFSQAGEDSQVQDVMEFMRGDLGGDFYDVRVLASRFLFDEFDSYPVVPFGPMLTQTWNLLRPRGIKLPRALQLAQAYLCNALWTTFEREGAEIVIRAVEEGELS